MQKLLTVLSVVGLALASILSGVFIMKPGISRAYTSPGQPTSFVNDFAGVIDEASEQSLDKELSEFRGRTSNEIVVATVNDLGGDSIENYANELFREWGIGNEERNNGVLLLVAVNDREVRIEVGYGLEGAITDLETGQIVDNVLLPAFRNGDYAGGIRTAVAALQAAAEGEYSAPPEARTNTSDVIMNVLFYGVFGLVWLSSFLARSKSWWAGGVIGGVAALIVWVVADSIITRVLVAVLAPTLGLLLDWFVSRNYKKNISKGGNGGFFSTMGGFSGGSSGGGGFGGFSGGSSGGGGSSGSW